MEDNNRSTSRQQPNAQCKNSLPNPVKFGLMLVILEQMAHLLNPPWISDEAQLSKKLKMMAAKLSDYDHDDVAVVCKRWTDEHDKWPAWSNLKSELDQRIRNRQPQVEHRGRRSGEDLEARALATSYGQRALREGWAQSYLLDIADGRLAGFSYDEAYARDRLQALHARWDQARLAIDQRNPFARQLAQLSKTMDQRAADLAEKYLRSAA